MSHSLIVLPEDSSQQLLAVIGQAKEALAIKMFVFRHDGLFNAVVQAHKRGVKVRVMLNPARRDGTKENDKTRQELLRQGVEVKDSNPAFDVTHEKSVVIDDSLAVVQSFNWEEGAFSSTRDYGVVTSNAPEVAEILACFDADWYRRPFTPSYESLIWCVGNARQRIGQAIDQTEKTLWVENERFQDPVIIEHLLRACRRGIKMHILARPLHKLKKEKLAEAVSGLRMLDDVGAKIHTLHHLKLHAKLLFCDESKAVIGSINLAPGSFDTRRELAIQVTSKPIMERIHQVLRSDWENSRKIDLSDEGLLKELEHCDPEVREDLGLNGHKG